jgi:cytochrome c2
MKKIFLTIIPFILFVSVIKAEQEIATTTEETELSEEVVEEALDEGLLNAASIEEGKKLFNTNCAACHTIGKGKLTGPDLKDVTKRLEEDYLFTFIYSSQTLINSGDEYAVKIFNDYNKVPMPDHRHLNRENILNILAYITDKSLPKEEAAKTEGDALKYGIAYTITNPQNSVIDLPLIKMVFWGSVFIVCAFMISLSIIVTKK